MTEKHYYTNKTGMDTISKWLKITSCYNCPHFKEEKISRFSYTWLVECKLQNRMYTQKRVMFYDNETYRLQDTCPLPSCEEYQLQKVK